MLEFKVEKVNNHITRIFGFCGEMMYLVEGNEKAALLDTGSGFGSLKRCVSQLTSKPVIVLVTHGHVDHAMGALEFDEVYMNHEDDYIYEKHKEKDLRLEGLEMSSIKDTFTMEDYIESAPLSHFKDLKEGDSFDLGGIHIDVYALPGHTLGSLTFLIREDKILLTGDACNKNTYVFDTYSATIEEYYEHLKEYKEKVDGKYERILISHGMGDGYMGMIEDVIQVCEDIMDGKADDIPYVFRGIQAYRAKDDPHFQKGNVVYKKDHIFR